MAARTLSDSPRGIATICWSCRIQQRCVTRSRRPFVTDVAYGRSSAQTEGKKPRELRTDSRVKRTNLWLDSGRFVPREIIATLSTGNKSHVRQRPSLRQDQTSDPRRSPRREAHTLATGRLHARSLLLRDGSKGSQAALPSQSRRRSLHSVERPEAPEKLELEERPLTTRRYLKDWQADLDNGPDSQKAPGPVSIGTVSRGWAQAGGALQSNSSEDLMERTDDSLLTEESGLDDEVSDARLFFGRGDLIELGTLGFDRGTELAFFVRDIENHSQFFTEQGRWVHIHQAAVRFVVPSHVPADLLDPILPYLPTEIEPEDGDRDKQMSVPGEVGGPLQERLVAFRRQSEAIYRKHSATLDEAHPILAHETLYRSRTLSEMAETLYGVPAPEGGFTAQELFTVQNALWRDELAYKHGTTGHYKNNAPIEIRPRSETRNLIQVRLWAREFQDQLIRRAEASTGEVRSPSAEQIEGFIEKARKAISKSREIRPITEQGDLTPRPPSTRAFERSAEDPGKVRSPYAMVRKPTGVKFTAEDQMIIRLFELWAGHSSFTSTAYINAIPPMILQATGMYGGMTLDRPVGFTFLQEIGIYPPWENRTTRQLDQLWDFSGRHPLESQDEVRTRFREQHEKVWSSLDDTDRMKGLRKDWGSMDVYCIDSAGTKDVDDGISLERVPGTDSAYWIHVHIANPTAHISPADPMIRKAEKVVSSVYLPEKTHHMLPEDVVTQFSLAPGRPTLTFSSKIDGQGQITESNITPGVVHNVHYITPEDVDQITGIEQSAEALSWQVGGDATDATSHPSQSTSDAAAQLSTTQVEDIRTLYDLATARHALRVRNGAVSFNRPRAKVSIIDQGSPTDLSTTVHDFSRSTHYVGDPVIRLSATPLDDEAALLSPPVGGHRLVMESMVLANEMAALWCHSRHLPVPYRGSVPGSITSSTPLPPSPPPETLLDLMALTHSLGRSTDLSTPTPHRPLGLPMYLRVTSPLRRFSDMLSHWQIEAALLYEARTGSLLVGSPPTEDALAFSKAQMDAMIPRVAASGAVVARTQAWAERFWTSQWMMRAWRFSQPSVLPATSECYIVREGVFDGGWEGWLVASCVEVKVRPRAEKPRLGLGLTAQEGAKEDEEEEYRPGDVVEVKIADVDTYRRVVVVEPVRLLRRVGA